MNNSLSVSRILKDLKEIQQSKLVGISALQLFPEKYNYVVARIQIQEGIYRGAIIPILIQLPPNYPLKPPAVYVIQGHPFRRRFHEHVLDWRTGGPGYEICSDLTSNISFGKVIGSGWTPAYTLQAILLQLQTFFARPDIPKSHLPTAKEIKQMIEESKKFKFFIKIRVGDKTLEAHSVDLNFPQFQELEEEEQQTESTLNSEKQEEDDDEEEELLHMMALIQPSKTSKKKQADDDELAVQYQRKLRFDIINRLVCPITKNIIDEVKNIQFGYPMLINKDRFNRLHVTPVIEIISSEGLEGLKIANKSPYETNYRSIFGAEFNTWIPMYINDQHFKIVKDKLFEIIRVSLGAEEFEPSLILRFFPPIMVKTCIHFLKGEVHESYAAIDAYCQFHFLFKKLIEIFPEVKAMIEEEVEIFKYDYYYRHKTPCGDLGEFMIKASLVDFGLSNSNLRYKIFQESLSRRVSWAMKSDSDLAMYQEDAEDLVDKFFNAGVVASSFAVLQYETSKFFMQKTIIKEQEERYGFISEDKTKEFRDSLLSIKEKINGEWMNTVECLELSGIDELKIHKMVRAAFRDAKKKYWKDVNRAQGNLGMSNMNMSSY